MGLMARTFFLAIAWNFPMWTLSAELKALIPVLCQTPGSSTSKVYMNVKEGEEPKVLRGGENREHEGRKSRGKLGTVKCREPAFILFAWPKSCGWREDPTANKLRQFHIHPPQEGAQGSIRPLFQPRLRFQYFQAQAQSPLLTQAWKQTGYWLPWILPRDAPSVKHHTKARDQ